MPTSNGYRRRLAKLERPHRCFLHPEEWLHCPDEALDAVVDFTRLTAAEHAELATLLLRLAPHACPEYGPCPRCGLPRVCLVCMSVGPGLREAYTVEEWARFTVLCEKALRSNDHAR